MGGEPRPELTAQAHRFRYERSAFAWLDFP